MHAIAEEATQAAWVIARQKLEKVDGPDQLGPSLVAVAIHRASLPYVHASVHTWRPVGRHGDPRIASGATSPDTVATTVAQGPVATSTLPQRSAYALKEVLDVPKFMDVHEGMVGVTPEALAEAHAGDLAIQDEEGVSFEHAWADPVSGKVFCLSIAPSAEAIQRIHTRNGIPPAEIHELTIEV